MRKLLFILLLLPGFAALGHDAYFFYQNPDKGVRFMDLGALWDKYHKESHDQWKVKLQEITSSVDEASSSVLPVVQDVIEQEHEEAEGEKPDYMQGFSQVNDKAGAHASAAVKGDNLVQGSGGFLQKLIGFLLEQKAVLVFFGIAALAYILNAILSRLFQGKSSMDKVEKHKKKKGPYKYGRK